MPPILLDGGMGTALWQRSARRSLPCLLNTEEPELVFSLHREFRFAGAQILLSNTFCAHAQALPKDGPSPEEVVTAGVSLAKQAAGNGAVALSMGPPFSPLSPEELPELYASPLAAGVRAGADLILFETFTDARLLAAAVTFARSFGVPVFASLTFSKNRKTPAGQTPEEALSLLLPDPPDAVGINCSDGSASALPLIRRFREQTDLPLLFKPNTGLSDASLSPEAFAEALLPAASFVSYLGGCCGASPAHIKALHDRLSRLPEK